MRPNPPIPQVTTDELLVGSFVLAVIAWVDERWGFLLLEGVWSIISAISLVSVTVGKVRGEGLPPK